MNSRLFTFLEIGSPHEPKAIPMYDGTTLHLDEDAYAEWKDHGFRGRITCELIDRGRYVVLVGD